MAEQDIYLTAEQDIYLLWSPTLQPGALDNLHLMYHLHKAAAPWEQGHPLQLYCLNSHLGENGGRESWQQQWQGLSQLAPLAAVVVPELPTLTQPLHPLLSLPSPTKSTAGSCGASVFPYHLLMHL